MRRVAAKFVPKLLNCDQKQHRMNIVNEMLDSVRDDPNLLQRIITGDEAGVVHHEFLPQGRTVNMKYYLQVMRNLREAIRQKRPDLSPCDFFLFPKLKRPKKGRRYATLDEIKTASKEELKKISKNDFLSASKIEKTVGTITIGLPLSVTTPQRETLGYHSYSESRQDTSSQISRQDDHNEMEEQARQSNETTKQSPPNETAENPVHLIDDVEPSSKVQRGTGKLSTP
ncbi:hypothetical protein LAZ67_6003262 [Cordylochernes scorpioides]|uniref:Uncharacterized protein n=1 Tax=Cordylochernes scorpioides TaxID=51811 RepID=A0ABY6KND0_9ARAC|nr:hypothetical protein LAZ67_6003262 [Cordylochernes scorpioides]